MFGGLLPTVLKVISIHVCKAAPPLENVRQDEENLINTTG
jgi:hypothetical protein